LEFSIECGSFCVLNPWYATDEEVDRCDAGDACQCKNIGEKVKLFFIFLLISKSFCKFAHEHKRIIVMIGTRSITDMYMVVLASLSNSDKLDLIAKLSNSMRDDADKKRMRPNLRTCFKGDWSNIDADNLRSHDYHGRTVETW